MSQTDMKAILARIADGARLSQDEAGTAFEIIMSGNATPIQLGAFLMALRLRGETVDEITGAALVMRSKARTIHAPPDTIDTVGTGGDNAGTFNISTAAALVVAACGVPVAKHGNRAASSKCGAADVLAELGVNLDADMDQIATALTEAGMCFLWAPRHHDAMRNVRSARTELGTRTIFNLLGPLTNPAGAAYQLVGVYDRKWIEPLAHVLKRLGTKAAWVVHGADGLDEVTTTGVTYVAQLRDAQVTTFEVTPADAGLPRARPEDLRGGDAATNAKALRELLTGAKGAYRDIVLLNSAATLLVAGKVNDLKAGVSRAGAAIDNGEAKRVLTRLVMATGSQAPQARGTDGDSGDNDALPAALS
jgi:anthranilate phosphoribosyltransferase